MGVERYINKHGKPCYRGVTADTEFSADLFHKTKFQFEDDRIFAFNCNLGSLTVLNRMTGFGYRDVESGYRDKDDNFWLASGGVDVRFKDVKTVGEAINIIKKHANTCVPNINDE